MSYFISRMDSHPVTIKGGVTCPLVSEEAQGCVAGFSSGITHFTDTDYPEAGVHDDQEGFIVLESEGWALVGDEEYRLQPDVCFCVLVGSECSVFHKL